MIIGLTGSIGSGKSTVSKRLASLGARVLDADAVSRALTRPGGEALPAIFAAFGPDVIDERGALDRRALAKIVFSDAAAREKLNAILHPMVRAHMQKETLRIQHEDKRALIVWDVPLLIEAGWHEACDEVWLVLALEALRIARVSSRDNAAPDEVRARILAQMGDEQKARFADEIIENNGGLEALYARVDGLYRRVAEGTT